MSFAQAAGLESPHEEVLRLLQRVTSRLQALGTQGLTPHLVQLHAHCQAIADLVWAAEHGGSGSACEIGCDCDCDCDGDSDIDIDSGCVSSGGLGSNDARVTQSPKLPEAPPQALCDQVTVLVRDLLAHEPPAHFEALKRHLAAMYSIVR